MVFKPSKYVGKQKNKKKKNKKKNRLDFRIWLPQLLTPMWVYTDCIKMSELVQWWLGLG